MGRLAELFGPGFCTGEFDVVRFSNVLEHAHSPTAALVEACRVTNPGGIVVVGVGRHGSPRDAPEWGAKA